METLILFCRSPLSRRPPSRLAQERGEQAALQLATAFLVDTAETCARWRCERVAVDHNRRLVFAVDPVVEDPVIVDLAFRAGARLERQRGDDPGSRLRNAIDNELARGARSVAVIGADTPTLPLHLIDHAFRALLWERVVLGPTFSGGVWLVGVQRPAPTLPLDQPWTTPSVVARALSKLRASGVNGHLLPFWYDVEDAGHLERLVWHVRALRAEQPDAAEAVWAALQRIGLVSPSSSSPADRTS